MSYQIRPIGPGDVKKVIPDFVIEAVNELINEKHRPNDSFLIRRAEIKERVAAKTTRDFESSWLDFEELYRAQGWDVYYDAPAYCESYEAFFRFSEKR